MPVGHIVEVVLWVESLACVVAGSEIHHTFWGCYRLVVTSHMIRHEVYKHLQTCLMRTTHKLVKFLHATGRIVSQITTHAVIVRNSIRRTSLSFYHMRILLRNSIFGIVGLRGLLQQTRVPNRVTSKLLDGIQCRNIEITHLATTVFFDCAIFLAGGIGIAE